MIISLSGWTSRGLGGSIVVHMDYNELIRNWHTKASNGDPFSRFVFEYLAFIAFLKKKKFIEAKDDRDSIQSLKQDEHIKTVYLIAVQNDTVLKATWKEVIIELEKLPLGNVSSNGDKVGEIKWWNNSHLSFNNRTPEQQNQTKGVIHDLDDWGNMVEFWYSVRNNLFHGAKDPENTRDSFLVEKAYETLGPLVDILILDLT